MTWNLRATIALVLALSTFPAVFSHVVKAQNPANATAGAPTKATASASAESRGGPKEGIKVHGHWIIDVRNPDGTLVSHHEFENVLTSTGAYFLTQTLQGVTKPNFWQIILRNSINGTLPWSSGNQGIIADPNDASQVPAFNISKTLAMCVHPLTTQPCADGSPPPPFGTFLLSGSITVERDGSIGVVSTYHSTCPNGVCNNTVELFTDHQLTALVNGSCPANSVCEVSVVARQVVVVTVAISFS